MSHAGQAEVTHFLGGYKGSQCFGQQRALKNAPGRGNACPVRVPGPRGEPLLGSVTRSSEALPRDCWSGRWEARPLRGAMGRHWSIARMSRHTCQGLAPTYNRAGVDGRAHPEGPSSPKGQRQYSQPASSSGARCAQGQTIMAWGEGRAQAGTWRAVSELRRCRGQREEPQCRVLHVPAGQGGQGWLSVVDLKPAGTEAEVPPSARGPGRGRDPGSRSCVHRVLGSHKARWGLG